MRLEFVKKINSRIIMINISDLDSNIYLIDGKTIVDSGTGSNFVRLYEIFKKLNLDFDNIGNIVNTHMHWDHIGGNGFFKNAKIHIHEKDADVLERGDSEKSNAMYFNGNMKPMKVEKKLKDGDEVFGFRVIHSPGHTPGSVCLFDPKDKILISGDTIFSDGVGRTDLPGGNEADLEKSIERLSQLDVEIILPGHGEPVLKDGKKAINNIITSVADKL